MPLFTVGEVLTAALANQMQMSPIAKAVAYTAVDGDFVILTGGHTVTLPAASNQSKVLVYAADANTANGVTSAGAAKVLGAGLGAGAAAGTVVPLGTQGAFMLLRSDGTNWYVTAGDQDTGWVAVSMPTHVTAGTPTPQVRVTNGAAQGRGQLVLDSTGIAGGATIFSVPSSALPSGSRLVPGFAVSTSSVLGLTVSAAGNVTANGSTASVTLDISSLAYGI